jgi:hypothetical protein
MFCLSKRQRKTHTIHSSLPPSSQIEQIPTSADNDDSAPLCSTCSALNIRAILHDGILEENAVPLGHITDVLNKFDQCGLCRLITTVIRSTWQLDKRRGTDLTGITCTLYAERCGYPKKIQNKTSPAPRELCHRLCIKTSSRPRNVYIAMMDAQSHLEMEIQLLEEDASKVGRTRELHGRRVGKNADVDLLKRWLHTCANEHQDICEKVWWRDNGEILPKSVRVVDVVLMAIVPIPPTCRYVALSYVWGGPGDAYWTTMANLKQRSISGGLDISMMPGTISDTIQLVRQLGERYLWIDALCIVQDDLDDKAVQIGVMELIYGSSAFTIIAVGCTSARDPLPGIRPGSRDPKQQIVKIQGLHLAVPLAVPNEAIASSVWNERGWTYQEVMLSRRRIFFTAHQMYFECRRDVWNEDVVAEPINHIWDAHPLKYLGVGQLTSTGTPPRWNRDGYLIDYMEIISEYTQRKLTVESDIVDAVTALFNALTKGFKVAEGDRDKAFRFGMPLENLERALLWQPTSNAPHSRRAPAGGMRAPWPSWSWAAWRGATRYSGFGVFLDIQSGSDSNANGWMYQSLVEEWYIIDNDGQPVRQDVRRPGRTGEYFLEAHSRTYTTLKGEIEPQLLTENGLLRPGTLVFWTSSAHFDVTKADDVVGADAMANYAIYSILSDIPQPSTLAGRVILPCSTKSPTSYEFVVLSRADERKGLYDEDKLGKGYSGCMLYVMAVQKMQNERQMVERVGVGVIFEHAWLNSTVEQKLVFLG